MSFLAWPLTFLALAFMYPWVQLLFPGVQDGRSDRSRIAIPKTSPLLIVLTTLALSIGTLTLIMLLIGMLGIRIDWRLTAILCAVLSVAGWFALLNAQPHFLSLKMDRGSLRLVKGGSDWRWIIILIGVIAGLILFNAVWWPFGIDDAVTIYATLGKAIAQTGQLPRGSLYEAYPMLIPLAYAFTHQAAGWTNEYLAALIPALLSISVVGVAFELGRELYNKTTGMIAALLIVLTPLFAFWASASYVDLPAGFFYGMAALYLKRASQTEKWTNALLAGIMAGLAAWTKNSALLIVISIGLWFLYRWWARWRQDLNLRVDLEKDLKQAGGVALGFLAVAAPWYIRNVAVAGLIIPATGWTWLAEHTVWNLFPYLAESRYFASGLIFTAGLIVVTVEAVRSLLRAAQRPAPDSRSVFLAIFHLPFFVIWWLLFSYDSRFLLVLTPILAVMGAHLIQFVIQQLELREIIPGRRAQLILSIFVVLLALPAASAAISYKKEMLQNPFMSDADKHRLRLGADRYDMALYLRTLPAGSSVWTQDLLLPYQADGVQMTVGLFPTAEQLQNFDYWVLSPGEALPDWFGEATPVHIEGDYRLYKVSEG